MQKASDIETCDASVHHLLGSHQNGSGFVATYQWFKVMFSFFSLDIFRPLKIRMYFGPWTLLGNLALRLWSIQNPSALESHSSSDDDEQPDDGSTSDSDASSASSYSSSSSESANGKAKWFIQGSIESKIHVYQGFTLPFLTPRFLSKVIVFSKRFPFFTLSLVCCYILNQLAHQCFPA